MKDVSHYFCCFGVFFTFIGSNFLIVVIFLKKVYQRLSNLNVTHHFSSFYDIFRLNLSDFREHFKESLTKNV